MTSRMCSTERFLLVIHAIRYFKDIFTLQAVLGKVKYRSEMNGLSERGGAKENHACKCYWCTVNIHKNLFVGIFVMHCNFMVETELLSLFFKTRSHEIQALHLQHTGN